jgi:hypothetical protein
MEVQITNISFGFFNDDKLKGYSNVFEYVLDNVMETVIDKYYPPRIEQKPLNGFRKFYQKEIK